MESRKGTENQTKTTQKEMNKIIGLGNGMEPRNRTHVVLLLLLWICLKILRGERKSIWSWTIFLFERGENWKNGIKKDGTKRTKQNKIRVTIGTEPHSPEGGHGPP